jgi:C4-dicarboxylate-specific signal transduction histidine kinase
MDINQTIRDVVVLMRNEAEGKGVTLEMDLATDLTLVVGDRVQLQQVILNLLMNGAEAATSVTDGERRVQIRSRQHESDKVLVAVRDSGEGIEPENLEKIFDAFYTNKWNGNGPGDQPFHY